MLRTQNSPFCLPVRAFEEQHDVTVLPLLRHCRAEANVLQDQQPHESTNSSQRLRGSSSVGGLWWVSTTAHQNSSKAKGSLKAIFFPIRSKTVSLWQELGLPYFLEPFYVCRWPNSQSHPKLINNLSHSTETVQAPV